MTSLDIVQARLADIVAPDGHPNAGEATPVLATVVRRPEGVLVFDTGIGDPHPEVDQTFRPIRRSHDEALASAGVGRSDVVAIVNCHLHFDHCGGNRSLAGAPIYVQRTELDAARAPSYTIREWVEFPGAEYVELNGEAEILEGVQVIPTPGHSPGHQSLVLETREGTTVLAGQAVFTSAEWDGETDPRVCGLESAWDRDAYAASIRRLRALDPVSVYFGHDPTSWHRP